METVSENTPKPKRGRPKSFQRICADDPGSMAPDGCTRTKINWQLTVTFLGIIDKSTPEEQIRLMGYTCEELRFKHGGKLFPGAYKTGMEVARYLTAIGDTTENRAAVLGVMLMARDEKIPWRDIAAHFRKLRLGSKEGDSLALFTHLARAYDDYIRNFPATKHQCRIGGIRNLLEAVELPSED